MEKIKEVLIQHLFTIKTNTQLTQKLLPLEFQKEIPQEICFKYN